MSRKIIVAISLLIPMALFVSSFYWFSQWGYGLLCFSFISFAVFFLRIKYEGLFERDNTLIQIASGITFFIVAFGVLGVAILAYSVSSDTDTFRTKPD